MPEWATALIAIVAATSSVPAPATAAPDHWAYVDSTGIGPRAPLFVRTRKWVAATDADKTPCAPGRSPASAWRASAPGNAVPPAPVGGRPLR